MHTHTHTVCPSLSLANGDVRYLPANRDIGSIATYTCNSGYQLTSPQVGMIRTCGVNGWSEQNFTCERSEYYNILVLAMLNNQLSAILLQVTGYVVIIVVVISTKLSYLEI